MEFKTALKAMDPKTPEQLLECMISTIDNSDVARFVRDVVDDEIMKTFKKAASSSGKYHPEVSNGDWGLLNHTALTLLVFDTFYTFYKVQGKYFEDTFDSCRAALILHDAWKYTHLSGKVNANFTTKEHGYVGAQKLLTYIRKHGNDYESKAQAIIMDSIVHVRYHMSNWCHNIDESNYVKTDASTPNILVMLADFISSNKALFEYTKIC